MFNQLRLDPDRSMLLIIDIQQKLLPLIQTRDRLMEAASLLIRGCRIFNLPILVTEQYPKGIGSTEPAIAELLNDPNDIKLEKMAFSCCGDDVIRDAVRKIDRPQIIICGIEAHVCVQQTVLDLVTMDYDVHVCADAIGARHTMDEKIARDRMRHTGAVITTVESALFELCNQCGTADFKAMSALIKEPRPALTAARD
jgi:nicotinamidase-related amidase